MESGTPIRYPSTALLSVSTEDGFQYTKTKHELIEGPNPANITINKGRTLIPGQFTRIALTEAQIEWNIPNVNENNNTLTIELTDLSGVSFGFIRVEILIGFYSPAELITELEKALNTNSLIVATFTLLGVSAPFFEIIMPDAFGNAIIGSGGPAGTTQATKLPRINIKLESSASAVARFRIINSKASPSITGLPTLQNDLCDMLGLIQTTGAGNNIFTEIESAYASFQYTPYVDLLSQTLTKNQKVSDSDSSDYRQPHKLARIYLANEGIQPFFASATYDLSGALVGADDNVIGTAPCTFRREFKFPKQIQWNKDQYIDYIELQLLDSHGQLIPIETKSELTIDENGSKYFLPPQADFRFTLQLSEV